MQQPQELTLTIMELRAYAQAKRLVEGAKSESDLPPHPMINRVWEVLGDQAAERKAARAQRERTNAQ